MGEMTDDLIAEEEHLASLEVPPWDAGTDPATTEELLAAALDGTRTVQGSRPLDTYHLRHAAAILATEAGQTIARRDAIGAAVERLPDEEDWVVTHYASTGGQPSRWRVNRLWRTDADSGQRPTLPAAIAAALGTKP